MGMHEGILAADKPWPDLLSALQRHIGTLEDRGLVAPAQWLELPQGEDAFHVTSHDGRSFVLDPAMVLTSSPDLVVSLSHDLDCMVASIGAETVSGTFWLTAAEKGRLVRLHWNVRRIAGRPRPRSGSGDDAHIWPEVPVDGGYATRGGGSAGADQRAPRQVQAA